MTCLKWVSSKSFCTMDRRDLRSVGFVGRENMWLWDSTCFIWKKCLIQKKWTKVPENLKKKSKYLKITQNISKNLEISRKISMLQKWKLKGNSYLSNPDRSKNLKISRNISKNLETWENMQKCALICWYAHMTKGDTLLTRVCCCQL